LDRHSLLTALSLLLAFLTAWLEIVLLPYLLNMIVKFFLSNLEGFTEILEEMMMIVLFSPVRRIEPVVVPDGRLHASIHQ
jgi:hypothetical protein